MNFQHKELAAGRWQQMSLVEQMANVGSDVERAFRRRKEGDAELSRKFFEGALELLDFTIADPKNKGRRKEVLRVREFLVDYFMFDNQYGFTDEYWQKYFYDFGYAAAIQRGR